MQRAGLAIIGGVTGIISGIMGIGGGVVLVPGTQALGRLGIREAIACSSSAICITASIGAAIKLSTLHTQGYSPFAGLSLAATLGSWAILGSLLGSAIIHRVPTRMLRWLVGALMLAAAVRLALNEAPQPEPAANQTTVSVSTHR